MYYFLHLFSPDRFAALTSLSSYKFLIRIYEFFKNRALSRVFYHVNVSNLENALQGNLRTGRVRECIFKASGGTDFENFLAQWQAW